VRQPRDTGDAVADFEHATHLGAVDLGPEALDVLAEHGRDIGRIDGEFRHG